MRDLFTVGLIMVLMGVGIIAMTTTTQTGLYVSVGSLCAATKMVMDRVDELERRKAVEMEA